MAELAAGQREASPALQPLLALPPSGRRPIRERGLGWLLRDCNCLTGPSALQHSCWVWSRLGSRQARLRLTLTRIPAQQAAHAETHARFSRRYGQQGRRGAEPATPERCGAGRHICAALCCTLCCMLFCMLRPAACLGGHIPLRMARQGPLYGCQPAAQRPSPTAIACLAAPVPPAGLQVLDEVGDEAAVYSPLGRGASALLEQGLLPGPWGSTSTPRSTSPGPLVSDGGTTPRSPWCVRHARAGPGRAVRQGSACLAVAACLFNRLELAGCAIAALQGHNT